MSQVHSKFKVFISTPVGFALDPAVAEEAAKFFRDRPAIAPKSVGIEYLEQTNHLVLSVGYNEADPSPHPPVKLDCVSLGRLALDAGLIETAMSSAASGHKNVICHEFYVNDGEFFMILLSLVE